MTRILLLENAEIGVTIIQHYLKKAGLEVVAGIRVLSLNPFVIVTLNLEQVTVDLSEFQLVLIDHNVSGNHKGPEVAEFLNKLNVACIGIPSMPFNVEKMQAAGCKRSLWKVPLLVGLHTGVLDLTRWADWPADIQDTLLTMNNVPSVREAMRAEIDQLSKTPV